MEYKILKAEDYCESVRDGTHDSPKQVEKGFKLITSKHIRDNSIDFESAYCISEEDYIKVNQRSLVEKNDILYSMIGTIGLIYRVKENPKFAIKNMGLFKVRDELKSKWLFYYLKSPDMIRYIKTLRTGSTQQYVTLKNLRELPIKFPKQKEDMQKVIKILENIDRKIELNDQINDNLHVTCELLFKKSFNIENIDKKKLEEVCYEITRGYTKNYVEKSNLINLNQKVNKGEILEKQYFKYLDEKQSVPENRFVRKNDILLNSLGQGTLGRVHLYKENVDNVVADQHITIIRTDNTVINPYYLYYLLITKEYQSELEGLVTGTTGMQMLNISAVRELKIPVPDKEKLDIFENSVKWMQEKINANNLENENLIKLRDTLLPEIMNGEIDVDKIEI